MPTIAQMELLKPKSWDEFEDICWDLYTRLCEDPHADRFDHSGLAEVSRFISCDEVERLYELEKFREGVL